LGKPARRGSTKDFLSKPALEALGQRTATCHQWASNGAKSVGLEI